LRAAIEVAAVIGCTVKELGVRMDSEEFGWWLAYRSVQPFGPMALMPALAELLAAIANGPGTRKDKRGWRPDDFIDRNRWKPAESAAVKSKGPSLAAIKAFFSRLGR
jgi:hypothetical protein